MVSKLSTIQVKDYVSIIPDLLEYFKSKVLNFKGGRLVSYLDNWKLVTSDSNILDMVSGAHIEFSSTPIQVRPPITKVFSSGDKQVIASEIKSLLGKGVVVPYTTDPGKFISPIFTTPKKDGSYRMILNLKKT